jgi:hypothetical protein
MVIGSAIKGLPQITRILRARSVQGLSLSAFYGDCLVFMTKSVYHARRGYPISAWAELLLLMGQQVLCITLYHMFGDAGLLRPVIDTQWLRRRGGKFRRFVLWLSDAAVLVFVACMLLHVLPFRFLPLMNLAIAPLIICSYAAQVVTNVRRKSTGQLAVLTVLMRWVFSLVRVCTTITQLGGDLIVLANHALGALGCSILLFQIWRYGCTDDAEVCVTWPWQKQKDSGSTIWRFQNYVDILMWQGLGGFRTDIILTESSEGPPSQEEKRSAFEKIDKDGDGKITREELVTAVKSTGQDDSDTAEQIAERMIEKADKNGDGSVNFDEYCDVLDCEPESR